MKKRVLLPLVLLSPFFVQASEADLLLPDFRNIKFFNEMFSGWDLLMWGSIIVILGLIFGLYQAVQIKKHPVHKSMADIAKIIYETCKTYLLQQGKFLIILFAIIGVAIVFYFGLLSHKTIPEVLLILMWTVFGISGSYAVAWFGIRINTLANCRTSFASLKGKP